MADEAKRAALIALVDQIRRAEGTEQEDAELLAKLRAQVVHPAVSNLIYYPHLCGLGDDPSSEQIVDAALAYRPILLGPPAEPDERNT